MALRIPPGVFRKRFGFQRWMTYQADEFKKVSAFIGENHLDDVPFRVYGSDIDGRAIAAARANSENAGTTTVTLFKTIDIKEVIPAPTPGILITNPPYGERLEANTDLIPLFKRLGEMFRVKFKGWKAFVLLTRQEHLDAIGLEPFVTHRVFNGAIECRFVGFNL